MVLGRTSLTYSRALNRRSLRNEYCYVAVDSGTGCEHTNLWAVPLILLASCVNIPICNSRFHLCLRVALRCLAFSVDWDSMYFAVCAGSGTAAACTSCNYAYSGAGKCDVGACPNNYMRIYIPTAANTGTCQLSTYDVHLHQWVYPV